jgi:glycosyltransferase involved in cell wall biosynthesis
VLDRITPLVLTRDEEANVARTLGQLGWATDIVVVDSDSTDSTPEIVRTFPNVRFFSRTLDTLAGQTTYGLQMARTDWVLLLDADYYVPGSLARELEALEPPPGVHGYRAPFRYAVDGRPLRASLYPARIVLLDRRHATIWQDGHAHRVSVEGHVDDLRSAIVHDDRKSFARFIQRQKRYMREEADKLRAPGPSRGLSSRVRKLIFVAPFAVLFQTLFVKGLLLDGRAGIRYAAERFVAEAMLSWELLRRLLRGGA